MRTIDNTTITAATQTGTWTATTALGNVNLCVSTVAPTVTTLPESSVAATSAVLGGNVTADGGDTVTNRGVCYKTSASVTIGDNKTQIGTGTGAFSNTVSSLSVNTRYYFRAYAQNSAGTSLGSESNFWTLANVPSAPTVANPTSSSLDITVNANGNPSSTEFAIQRTSDNQYLQSDGSWGASAVWATAATWGTKTATGLSPSTTYYFRVKARNGVNVETAFGSTGSGTTSASGCSTYWHALYHRGAPVYTYYLGDRLANQFEFGINTDTTGWSVEYGVGRSTDGSSWTWRTADWSRMDDDDNRVWISKTNEHQFTATGNWYYAGRFTTGSCTYYADGDWEETTGGGLAAAERHLATAKTKGLSPLLGADIDAKLHSAAGRHREAILALSSYVEIVPAAYWHYYNMAWEALHLGEDAHALACMEKAQSMASIQQAEMGRFLAGNDPEWPRVDVSVRHWAASIDNFSQIYEFSRELHFWVQDESRALQEYDLILSHYEAALACWHRAAAASEADGPFSAAELKNLDRKLGIVAYNKGCILAKLGREEDSLAALRQAFRHDVSLRENARTDADLAVLRENPDFIELTQSPDARMRRGDSLQAQSIWNARTL